MIHLALQTLTPTECYSVRVKLQWMRNVRWLNLCALLLLTAALVLAAFFSSQLHRAGTPLLPAYLLAAAMILVYLGKE